MSLQSWSILKIAQPHCWTVINRLFAAIHTYSPELDVSAHFELHSPAHDVDTLVSTNDGLAVTFNVQVRRCAAGDLTSQDTRGLLSQHVQPSVNMFAL